MPWYCTFPHRWISPREKIFRIGSFYINIGMSETGLPLFCVQSLVSIESLPLDVLLFYFIWYTMSGSQKSFVCREIYKLLFIRILPLWRETISSRKYLLGLMMKYYKMPTRTSCSSFIHFTHAQMHCFCCIILLTAKLMFNFCGRDEDVWKLSLFAFA